MISYVLEHSPLVPPEVLGWTCKLEVVDVDNKQELFALVKVHVGPIAELCEASVLHDATAVLLPIASSVRVAIKSS